MKPDLRGNLDATSIIRKSIYKVQGETFGDETFGGETQKCSGFHLDIIPEVLVVVFVFTMLTNIEHST